MSFKWTTLVCLLIVASFIGCSECNPVKSTAGMVTANKRVLIPRQGGIIEVQIIKVKPDNEEEELVLMTTEKEEKAATGKRYIVSYKNSSLPETEQMLKGMKQLYSIKDAGDARMLNSLDISSFTNEPTIDLTVKPKQAEPLATAEVKK